MKKLLIRIQANKKAVWVAVIAFIVSLIGLNTDQADSAFKFISNLFQ